MERKPDHSPYVGQEAYHRKLVHREERKRQKSMRQVGIDLSADSRTSVDTADIEMSEVMTPRALPGISEVLEEEEEEAEAEATPVYSGRKSLAKSLAEATKALSSPSQASGGGDDSDGDDLSGRKTQPMLKKTVDNTSEEEKELVHIVQGVPLRERIRRSLVVYGEVVAIGLLVTFVLAIHALYAVGINFNYYEYNSRFSFNFSIMPVATRVSLATNDGTGWFLLCCWPVSMYVICYRVSGKRVLALAIASLALVISIATYTFYLILMPLSEKYELAINQTFVDPVTGEVELLPSIPDFAFKYIFYFMIVCFAASTMICAWRVKVVSMHLRSVILFIVYWFVYLGLFIGFVQFYG